MSSYRKVRAAALGSKATPQARALQVIDDKASDWIGAHRKALADMNVKTVSVYITPGAPDLITAEVSGGREEETERFAEQLVFTLTPHDTRALTNQTGPRAFTYAV